MTQKILAAIIRARKTIMAAAAMYFVISIVPLDTLAFTAPISSPDVIMFTIAAVVFQEPLIYRNEIPPLLKAELGICRKHTSCPG
jgi:hypothetical protein